jgi:hypothetical protein
MIMSSMAQFSVESQIRSLLGYVLPNILFELVLNNRLTKTLGGFDH